MPILKESIRLAAELVIATKELTLHTKDKAKRVAELVIATKELTPQAKDKTKRAAELVIATKELVLQTKNKAKRAAELVIATKTLQAKEIIDLAASNVELRDSSLHDPLTHLANRRLLSSRIEHIQATNRRNKQQSALLFVDLDHFKLVNDKLGHACGDLLLQQVAERLEACTREGDTVARIGGDEFVVLLEALGEDLAEATVATKKIAKKLFALLDKPYQLNEHVWKSAASVGVALFGGKKLTPDELLKQADVAMYHAKLTEGNAMQFFERTSPKNKKSVPDGIAS